MVHLRADQRRPESLARSQDHPSGSQICQHLLSRIKSKDWRPWCWNCAPATKSQYLCRNAVLPCTRDVEEQALRHQSGCLVNGCTALRAGCHGTTISGQDHEGSQQSDLSWEVWPTAVMLQSRIERYGQESSGAGRISKAIHVGGVPNVVSSRQTPLSWGGCSRLEHSDRAHYQCWKQHKGYSGAPACSTLLSR